MPLRFFRIVKRFSLTICKINQTRPTPKISGEISSPESPLSTPPEDLPRNFRKRNFRFPFGSAQNRRPSEKTRGEKLRFPSRLCSRLSLSFHKTGCASANPAGKNFVSPRGFAPGFHYLFIRQDAPRQTPRGKTSFLLAALLSAFTIFATIKTISEKR